jgi:uncharacterized protein involved in type VI secretion and phage assembly
MRLANVFEIPTPSHFTASYLAVVVSVQDPEELSRVQVRLLNCDGIGEQDAPIWARVAVPFAGPRRGAFMLPDVDDEVLVTFLHGDPSLPIVVGGLWNGSDVPPESLGGAGDRVDRWTIVGKAGTRVAIVEEQDGQETISFTTPGGVSGELTDAGGGKIELRAGSTITIDGAGITVDARQGKVTVRASTVEVTAGQVKVEAAMSKFSGVVQCPILKATTIVADVYKPGAGNVW